MKTSYSYKNNKPKEENLADSIKVALQEDAKVLQVQEVMQAKTPVVERTEKPERVEPAKSVAQPQRVKQPEAKKSIPKSKEVPTKPKNTEKPVKTPEPETPKKEKKGKGKIAKFAFILIVLLLAVAVLFYLKGRVSLGDKPVKQSVTEVVNSIGEFKVGSSDKEIAKVKSELNESKLPESEKKQLSGYLDTCSLYQQNNKELKGYELVDYNIGNPNMSIGLGKIREGLGNYTIDSLRTNIDERITGLQKSYTEYVNLRLELQSTTDVISFDSSKYTTMAANIKYNLNRKEIQCIIDTIVADKQVAEASTKLANAKTPEESSTAQSQLDKAKENQTTSQKALESIQNELETSIKK